jgi:hypothetical protein
MSHVIVHSAVVAYEYSCLPEDHPGRRHFTIRIERRGPHAWAVIRPDGYVLADDGVWDYEPQNSNRSEDWLEHNRFPHFRAAELAARWAPKLTVMGKTVEDALAPGGWHG